MGSGIHRLNARVSDSIGTIINRDVKVATRSNGSYLMSVLRSQTI